MAETVARRDEVADAVRAGYAEAMIAAKVWTGGRQRGWHPEPVVTPEQAEATFEAIARSFPRHVVN